MRASSAWRRTRVAGGAPRLGDLLALALGGALLGAEPGRAEAPAGGQFTAEERSKLAAGELVTRPLRAQRHPGLDLIGGSSWQAIDASPDVVWRAINDTAHYTRMLPRVLEARVVSGAGDVRSVFLRQGRWPIFVGYYLTVRAEPGVRRLRFELDQNRPHGVNAAWGFLQVGERGGGKALLAFGMAADAGRGIIAAVARGAIEKWMLRVPWTMKKFIEGAGKTLYAPERLAAGGGT